MLSIIQFSGLAILLQLHYSAKSPTAICRMESGNRGSMITVTPIETGKARTKSAQMTGRDGRSGFGRMFFEIA